MLTWQVREDDNVLNQEEKEMEYRKIQLQKLKEEVIDLEDLREGVSITDFRMNDFRVDLSNLFKVYKDVKKCSGRITRSCSIRRKFTQGAVFVLKNVNENMNIDKLNRLHPYYLVYIMNTGELRSETTLNQKILDAMRLACNGKRQAIDSLCRIIADETNDYYKMDHYSTLLKQVFIPFYRLKRKKPY